jgi:hypothetical protein
VLYLMVVTLILMHWLTETMTLAGARDLILRSHIQVVHPTSAFVDGFTFTLWSFRSGILGWDCGLDLTWRPCRSSSG